MRCYFCFEYRARENSPFCREQCEIDFNHLPDGITKLVKMTEALEMYEDIDYSQFPPPVERNEA